MDIKILGMGCPKCKEVERRVVNALAELGIAASVEKVADITKIMEYKVLGTPGLVIDGKVVSTGKIPRPEEIRTWIRQAGG
jgi:small redox-active disulfide protein 2